MAKVILNVRVDNYGFVLAIPGTLLAIAILWDWLPRAIDRAGGSGLLPRAAVLAILMMGVIAYLNAQTIALAERTVRVGSGGDAIWWNARGREVNRALAQVEIELASDGTFACIPEGIMLNYLLRRKNPTSHISYMPLEMLLFGEEAMLEAFERHPPEGILAVYRELQVYGMAAFGKGYGERLRDWILARYRPVGEVPVKPGQFQIVLLKRIEPAQASNKSRETAPADARTGCP